MTTKKPRRKALANKNTPRRLQLPFFAIVWLLMDRLQPPGWVWGAVGLLCALLFIAWVWDFFTAEDVEIT